MTLLAVLRVLLQARASARPTGVISGRRSHRRPFSRSSGWGRRSCGASSTPETGRERVSNVAGAPDCPHAAPSNLQTLQSTTPFDPLWHGCSPLVGALRPAEAAAARQVLLVVGLGGMVVVDGLNHRHNRVPGEYGGKVERAFITCKRPVWKAFCKVRALWELRTTEPPQGEGGPKPVRALVACAPPV